jgi:peptidoglycan/LPS O-acetylase OafA/YrhL
MVTASARFGGPGVAYGEPIKENPMANQARGNLAVCHFTSLDGLRAYMAWWIVFMHLLSLTGSESLIPAAVAGHLVSGASAVKVFMVVSGFVIAHLLQTRDEPYWRFVRRRAFRIFPIYLLCLLLAILLTEAQVALHVAPWVQDAARWRAGYDEQMQHFATHLGLHLALLNGAVPDSVLPFASWTIIGPAWSLSLEWQFYLLAPALLLYLRRSRLSCIVTTLCLLGLTAVFRSGVLGEWKYPSMVFLAMPFFLAGIFCRLFFARISALPVWWTIGVGLAAGYLLRDARHVICIWTFFMVAMRFESLPNTSPLIKTIRWIACNRLITALGKASYSTYLVHALVLAFFAQLLAWFHGGLTVAVARQAAVVTLLLLPWISLVLYNYVERVFMRLGARDSARREVAETIESVAGSQAQESR